MKRLLPLFLVLLSLILPAVQMVADPKDKQALQSLQELEEAEKCLEFWERNGDQIMEEALKALNESDPLPADSVPYLANLLYFKDDQDAAGAADFFQNWAAKVDPDNPDVKNFFKTHPQYTMPTEVAGNDEAVDVVGDAQGAEEVDTDTGEQTFRELISNVAADEAGQENDTSDIVTTLGNSVNRKGGASRPMRARSVDQEIGTKILNTSYEHAFVARNVARLIIANVQAHRVHAGDEFHKKYECFITPMYGYGRNTASLAHNDETVGVLVGGNVNVNDSTKIGVFTGISNTCIDYKQQYNGAYGKQKSVYIGAQGSYTYKNWIFSEILLISHTSYKDDVNILDQTIEQSHLKYNGNSCFYKAGVQRNINKGEHTFAPAVALYCDYIGQKPRDYKTWDGKYIAHDNKVRDFYISCQPGVHYTFKGKMFVPEVFLGYEFTLTHKIGKRAVQFDNACPRNKDNFSVQIGLDCHVAPLTTISVQCLGNYKKHHKFTAIGLRLDSQF